MRLDLGSPVRCSDGPYGELADVVVDPTTQRVAFLVVVREGHEEDARLVPVALARAGGGGGDEGTVLAATIEEVGRMEKLRESAYLRLGEFPARDPEWDVGIEQVYALPYYTADYGFNAAPVDVDPHVAVNYDRVPKGDVEIRRASRVTSSDGHVVGHVDGMVVDEEQHITHVVLEHGHLWGKREVAVPIGGVDRVENDEVVLSLTRDAVGDLEQVRVRR